MIFITCYLLLSSLLIKMQAKISENRREPILTETLNIPIDVPMVTAYIR